MSRGSLLAVGVLDRVSARFGSTDSWRPAPCATKRHDAQDSLNIEHLLSESWNVSPSSFLHDRWCAIVGSIVPWVVGFLVTWSPIEQPALSGTSLRAHSASRSLDRTERLRQETTLLASPLLGIGAAHLAFMQGVRVDQEPQGREVATGWVRLELELVR